MNKVILSGRLGKDPETKTFTDGNKVSMFSIATTESYKDKSGEWKNIIDWHNIVVGREVNYKKGDAIELEGRLKTRSYETNGEKRYITEVKADRTRLLIRNANPESTNQNIEPTNQNIEQANGGLPF